MSNFFSRAVLLLVLVFAGSEIAGAATYFTGNLAGSQEVPPTGSTATGFGRVTLNNAETSMTVSVYYGSAAAPLSSNVVAGHIHGPAGPGVNAPIIFDLAPTIGVTFGSVVNMVIAVNAAQVADLKAGRWYFNIHTVNFGGGEIRGQIGVDSPYIAYQNGGQENPPVTTPATGSGAVSINAAGTQALVTATWNGLSGNAIAGHVHSGRSGVNGPIICDLAPPAAATGSVVDRLCTLTPAQATAMRTAQLYVNIHTGANPGGEIRGQIQRRRSTVLDFDGDSKTDYTIARNNVGANQIEWWTANSTGGMSAFAFGVSAEFSTVRIVAGDFDGDGRDDTTIWRTGAAPAAGFLILQSSDSTVRFEQFGITGDDPRVVYDYDGDGRCDLAVFRNSDDTWYFLASSNNAARNITFVRWGPSFANPGDYDGDGRGDFMNQIGGQWWILRSSDLSFQIVTVGTGGSFGVPGDYDGDGKTDVAVTATEGTPSTTAWYYVSTLNPTQNLYLTRQVWGTTARTRAQGDYDGDGRSDYAIWQTGAPQGFWVLPSNGSPHSFFHWGQSGDFAVAGHNNR